MSGHFSRFCLVLVLVAPAPGYAGGVVGSGTPGSCTEAALGAALAGGGNVSFNCGAAAHSIVLTGVKTVSSNTSIDGGGNITLSGNDAAPHFQVLGNNSLTITDLILTRGFGEFGSIENSGTLNLVDARIDSSEATGAGGAIANYGTLQLTDSVISGNIAHTSGGGIFNDAGDVSVDGGEISANSLSGTTGLEKGGGIYSVGGSLTVDGATIRDNFARSGGGIYNDGDLDLNDVVLEDNQVQYSGPADGGGLLHASGMGTISECRFIGNRATSGYGGGLWVRAGATLAVSDSTFSENQAVIGGAIVNSGTLDIQGSTISYNDGPIPAIGNGVTGGPGAGAALTLTNVTISNNSTTNDVVIAADAGTAVLDFVTIASNSSGEGAIRTGQAGTLSIKNSIIASNTPKNCVNSLFASSEGFNLSSDTGCGLTDPGDQNGIAPKLRPLANYGGTTETRLLAAGSPAIDAGDCSADVNTDQRGIDRPQRDTCDAGAVEREDSGGGSTTTSTSTTTLPFGECADPVAFRSGDRDTGYGAAVTASDALAILSAAVGTIVCDLCVCDVDGSGSIAATDALLTLRKAVGLSADLDCPPCT